jgi:predicted cobalt transporter CbtA
MTFALVRAGLPNTIVAIALAIVPLVALALSPAQHASPAPVQSAEVMVVAAAEPAASGNHAVPN